MNKFLKYLVVPALCLVPSIGFCTNIKDYPTVAVMNFGNKAVTSRGLREHDFSSATEYAIYQLSASGWFDLVDYEQLSTIAKMHAVNMSSLVDPNTAVAVGKFAGAKFMVVGNLTGLTTKENVFGYQHANKGGISNSQHVVTANVAVRIVDIETGRIVVAGLGSGSSTSTMTELHFKKYRNNKIETENTSETLTTNIVNEVARTINSTKSSSNSKDVNVNTADNLTSNVNNSRTVTSDNSLSETTANARENKTSQSYTSSSDLYSKQDTANSNSTLTSDNTTNASVKENKDATEIQSNRGENNTIDNQKTQSKSNTTTNNVDNTDYDYTTKMESDNSGSSDSDIKTTNSSNSRKDNYEINSTDSKSSTNGKETQSANSLNTSNENRKSNADSITNSVTDTASNSRTQSNNTSDVSLNAVTDTVTRTNERSENNRSSSDTVDNISETQKTANNQTKVQTSNKSVYYERETLDYAIQIGTVVVSDIQVRNAISKAVRDAIYGKMGIMTTLNNGKPLKIKTGF